MFQSSMFLSFVFEQGETESGWQATMRPTFLWPAPRMTWRIGWRRSAGLSGLLSVEVSAHTNLVSAAEIMEDRHLEFLTPMPFKISSGVGKNVNYICEWAVLRTISALRSAPLNCQLTLFHLLNSSFFVHMLKAASCTLIVMQPKCMKEVGHTGRIMYLSQDAIQILSNCEYMLQVFFGFL